jgi:hypothetical protein
MRGIGPVPGHFAYARSMIWLESFEDTEDFTERAAAISIAPPHLLTLTRSLSDSLLDVLPHIERRQV